MGSAFVKYGGKGMMVIVLILEKRATTLCADQ